MYEPKYIPVYVMDAVASDISRIKVDSKLSPMRAIFLDESYDRAARMLDVYLEDIDPGIRAYTDMLIGLLGSLAGILFGVTYNCAPSNKYNLTQSEQVSTISRFLLNPERDFVKNVMEKVILVRGRLTPGDIVIMRDNILSRATRHTIPQPHTIDVLEGAKPKASIQDLDKRAIALFENAAPTETGTVSVTVDDVNVVTDIMSRVSDIVDEDTNEFAIGSTYVDIIDRRVRENITNPGTKTFYQDCEMEDIRDRVSNVTNSTRLFGN